jgi:hypothetical protein
MNKYLFSHEKSLAESSLETNDTSTRYIADQLGVDPEAGKELQERIEWYDQLQSELAKQYLVAQKIPKNQKNILFFVNGWNLKENSSSNEEYCSNVIAHLLLKKSSNNQSYGFYIRWNQIGIVVNPGASFLDNFHLQGLHIKDIQHIIVTKNNPEAYRDIKRIYDLNYQLNKLNPDLHVIHYYITQSAYHELSHILKPHYKQEKNSLHCLELFHDSSEIEKESLGEGVLLNYFSANSKSNFTFANDLIGRRGTESIGIKLELKSTDTSDKSEMSIGYLSGTVWSPLLSHHLGPCDILVTGFGRTHPNDYGKLNYSEDCLGYFGTYSLLEEMKPKLLLCGEFDGWDGDIRLEIVKKLSKEFEIQKEKHFSTILPFDKGLMIDLNEFLIECCVSKKLLAPHEVRVIRTHNAFGNLQYLSHKCFL